MPSSKNATNKARIDSNTAENKRKELLKRTKIDTNDPADKLTNHEESTRS